jgi:hypothetical protein
LLKDFAGHFVTLLVLAHGTPFAVGTAGELKMPPVR